MLPFQIKTDKKSGEKYLETPLSGKPMLTIPQFNKGTAFSIEERQIFDLIGKLPALIEPLIEQVKRAYEQFQNYTTPLKKNIYLNQLHDNNLVLFYKLVSEHIEEMLPIIYTPTVGTAVKKFSREFQQARGLYISYKQRDSIETIFDNRSHPEVDLVVVTDGGRVLGIGDQGVGAMLIPVAKLMVYSVCGGISPYRTLPIMLDVGTDNEELHNDPFYLGWRHHRIRGQEYQEFIAKFVALFKQKFPNALLHWEDFGRENAYWILDHYRNDICTFNDDIQGTGVVTLAALLAAVKATDSSLTEQRIVMFGAGSAGMGIAEQICDALARFGVDKELARKQFWLVDKGGLLTEDTAELTPAQRPFVRSRSELNGWATDQNNIALADVIRHVKPTVLIGCSAQSGAFTQEIIETMAGAVPHPIIFPLSNPTEKAEAVPANLLKWSQGRALIATGSPFNNISFQNKKYTIAQCNNALAFPGLGLAVIALQAHRITDNMLWAASKTLASCAPVHQNRTGALLPALQDAKASAYQIAVAVATQACEDGVASAADETEIVKRITETMWSPAYLPFRRS